MSWGIVFEIVEVLSICTSANIFAFADFNTYHKDWLTYAGGTDRPAELCHNFSVSNELSQMVNFPTQASDCDSQSSALLDFFLSSDPCICCTVAFYSAGHSDHVFFSVSIDFPSNSKGNASFHPTAYDHSRAD